MAKSAVFSALTWPEPRAATWSVVRLLAWLVVRAATAALPSAAICEVSKVLSLAAAKPDTWSAPKAATAAGCAVISAGGVHVRSPLIQSPMSAAPAARLLQDDYSIPDRIVLIVIEAGACQPKWILYGIEKGR